MNRLNHILLVNRKDQPVGEMEKIEVHRQGKLHRAISVFIFHPDGRWLIQKRAPEKYHSANLWSNTCCSHPGKSEEVVGFGQRRLEEEMGFSCPLKEAFSFIYRAEFDNGLVENEFDHVLVGEYSGPINPDPKEASDWAWLTQEAITERINKDPDQFTVWFKKIYARVGKAWAKMKE